MDINTIGIILCIIIIIAVFIQLLRNRKGIIYEQNALVSQTKVTSTNGSTGTIEQSTYSIWFYVKDWNTNYGIEKCIFKRASNETDFGDLNISLGATNSDLIIKVRTQNSSNYENNYGFYFEAPPTQYSACSAKTPLSSTTIGCTGVLGSTGDYGKAVQSKCNDQTGCNYYSYQYGVTATYQLFSGTPTSLLLSAGNTTISNSNYKTSTGGWTAGSYYSQTVPSCIVGVTSSGCTGTSNKLGSSLDFATLCSTNLGTSCTAYSYFNSMPNNPTYTLLYNNDDIELLPSATSGYGFKNNNYSTCIIPDIELQRWINLVITISTNTMDVYINGELTRSQLLNNIAIINETNSIYISPNNQGFNGMNSKFQFWSYYMNPRQVKNIYRQGSGAISAEDVRVNITLYKGDEKRANLII